MQRMLILLTTVWLMAACARKPRMLDYISLPPPNNVTAKFVPGRGIYLRWDAPPDYLQARIADYLVFTSGQSLLYTPINRLPQPLMVVAARDTACWIETVPDVPDLFIHMRSRSFQGDLSLPSLPEIHLRLARQ